MKKKLTSLFAVLLAVILLATAIPVYAMDVDSTTVKEVEELREENVKHFEMTDGTYKAVVYNDAVHRKDADGVWQDIDNTLEAVKENGNTEYKSSDGRIKFSKNIKNGKIFELSENGYKISLSLSNKNLKDSNADVKNHKAKGSVSVFDSKEEQLEKLKSVDNLTKVRYNNIEDGIDIEYQIYSNNLKESIIVNSKKDSYVYTFELKLNKLSAALNEDGSISLKDEETGESKYTMPAPFMFDNKGDLSTDVNYTLTQSGRYKYTLTVTADTEWINNEARELPVTIDPSVEVDNSYGEAYVSSASPYTNYKKPSDGVLYLSSTQRIFLKFKLSPIFEFYDIIDASLIMQYYFYASNYGNMSIEAYTVPYSWDENTITWNNSVASHQSADGSADILSVNHISSSVTATENAPMVLPFDVTEAVKDWCSGSDNNGIALRRVSGMTNAIAFKGYYSEIFIGPLLEISYQPVSFYLRNVQSSTYIKSGVSNATLYPFTGQDEQKWQITYLGNEYHKIISVDSGKALTLTNGNVTLNNYTGSTNQMWSITKDNNGYYKISPRDSLTSFISESNNSVIVNTNQPNNNSDEWILYKYTGTPTFELQQQLYWCWAACARMIGSAHINSLPTQQQMAEYAVEENWTSDDPLIDYNQTGSVDHIGDALSYALGEVCVQAHNNGLGDDLVEEIINNMCTPIICAIGNIHFVVVYDCNYDSEGNLILSVYDPFDYDKFGRDTDDSPYLAGYPQENQYTMSLDNFCVAWTKSIIVSDESFADIANRLPQ